MDRFIQLLAAGAGSLGFSLLFNTRGAQLIWATLGGFLSWSVYLAAYALYPSDPVCYFLAAVVLTIYAEIMARLRKTPATVYLVAGTIPLIPGASLYRTMSSAVTGDAQAALRHGVSTLLLAAAIAAGILACMVIWNTVALLVSRLCRKKSGRV